MISAGAFGKPSSGGGVSIYDWGTGPFLVTGSLNERLPCMVDGEMCIAEFTGTFWDLVAPSVDAQAYAAANIMPPGAYTAPTVPVARQTWNAGWRLTAYDPNPFTTELRDFRLRFRNLTGQAVQDISFDLIHHLASSGTFTVCAGASSGGQDSAAWTTPVGILVAAAPSGTIAPGYRRVDISLPAPVANGSDILISVIPPTSSFTAVQGMNGNAWPDYDAAQFAGMSTAIVAADGSWPGGIGDFFGFVPGVHFRNLTGGAIVQVAHIGDSVGEQERPNTSSPNPLSREGWCTRGNAAEVSNGRRFWWNSVSNGTYTLTNYLARIAHLITTEWVDTVDVVSIQIWTHNEAPANVAAAIVQRAQIEVVADAIRAAGRGVVYTLLSPPSGLHQSADEIAGWQYMRDSYLTEPHVYIDDIVATGTAFNATYSEDLIHINEAGQILQAAALPARTLTALQGVGYIL